MSDFNECKGNGGKPFPFFVRRAASRLARRPSGAIARGFTLYELLAIILIVSILAIGAASVINRGLFDTAGFADVAQSAVAFAQKVAVAQRRQVFVDINNLSPNAIQVCYDAGCAARVAAPNGGNLVQTAPSGVAISAATFSFDPLGKPSAAQTITVTGSGTKSFVVEAETGLVH
jgi:MSHA pilin protein MshC